VASSNKTSNRNGSGGKQAASRARSANQLGSEHFEGANRVPTRMFLSTSASAKSRRSTLISSTWRRISRSGRSSRTFSRWSRVYTSAWPKSRWTSRVWRAEARLKVRLENLYDILDRVLTTLDRNPEILEGLVQTLDDTATPARGWAPEGNDVAAPSGARVPAIASALGTR
jgi:hypothetical protein